MSERAAETLLAPPSPGAVRAAAVLVALGSDAAQSVLRHLDETAVRRVAEAARELGRMSRSLATETLATYVRAMEGIDADLAGGDGILREATAAIHGEDVARRAFDGFVTPPPADEALGPVAQSDPEALAMVLSREHPQTVALVLGALEHERACEVIDHITEENRPEIIRRLATVEAVSPEVLREVGAALATELRTAMAGGVRKLDGRNAALAVLRRVSAEQQQEVIESIEQDDPELANELRSKLFTFEDLAQLSDRDVQTLLKDVESNVLITALKGASPSVFEKILGNMSTRASELIKDELSALGPMRLDVVEGAQQEIAKTALKLSEDGKITIVRPSDRMV